MLKPAETTPLTALKLAELIAGRRPPAGRGQHRHRRGRDRRGDRQSSRHRQDRLHRHRTEVGKIIQKSLAAIAEEATRSNSAARPRTSSSKTPPIDQAVEGIINGIFFNQGHVCCAGSRLFVQEIRRTTGHPQAQGPHGDAASSAIRSTRTPTSAPSTRGCSSTRSTSISQIGQDEGAEMWCSELRCPEHADISAGRRCF